MPNHQTNFLYIKAFINLTIFIVSSNATYINLTHLQIIGLTQLNYRLKASLTQYFFPFLEPNNGSVLGEPGKMMCSLTKITMNPQLIVSIRQY